MKKRRNMSWYRTGFAVFLFCFKEQASFVKQKHFARMRRVFLRKMAADRAALWREEMSRDILCFAQFWERILHFRRKSENSAQSGVEIVHLRRKKSNPAQSGVEIVHFRRKKPNPAQSRVEILHFGMEKRKIAQPQPGFFRS